jgi:integrin alpha FG-GAP repeat containing protein 1
MIVYIYSTDMVVIGCESTCIQVYLWYHNQWKFNLYEDATIQLPISAENTTLIEDVTAADFNYDGLVDLLVTTIVRSTVTGEEFKYRQLMIYTGYKEKNLYKFALSSVIETIDQVAIIDINGDLRVDLFGESVNNTRTFWVNQVQKKATDPLFLTVEQESPDGTPLLPLAYPATNIFIDIDGDCSADLFIVSCRDENYSASDAQLCKQPLYEIWLNRDGKLKREVTIPAPQGAGRPLFNDYDRDGDYDLFVPICYPQETCAEKNEILVMINQQAARENTDLCARGTFNLTQTQFSLPMPDNKRLVSQMSTNTGKYFPATLRAGDYNLDGYTDLVLPVIEQIKTTTGETKKVLQIELWRNVACTKSTECVTRTFTVQVDGVEDLPSFDVTSVTEIPAYNAFFLDLDETGVLDIMTTMQNPAAKNESIQGYYNNFFNDAYFLKTICLNGAKERGTLMPGITFKFTVSDLTGKKHQRIATQITQSTYAGLQPPYHLFGLGRTNGYIEEFFFGKPHESSAQNYQSNTAIIPNSQLVGLPYPVNTPKKWELELYVSPSGHTLWVAIAVFSTLILIGLPIIGLWRWEKYQDTKSKTKSSQMTHATSTSVLIG